ncbi:role in phospholipid translocation across the plasma membrane [Scheffersomyces stipitis CBS 6054]|uniref:Role in phospholipid translocation across the plasma membrane n=1 Tax=Scheffersomyces stipitis (strain ATCC 58785 / CBS 6054 / NBRC 10063 / NRRL Y-11545) TaxID=322104 RepID=A3GG49_PICST|nr:role in phospholipid translocation across the plasma membrane [Scheffersomyces stipitis CBS 6054]EAZ63873.2 role in phospholipid translocation across the plasma membrane [Scheffersomyces stipitis CBS 6054]
MASSADPSNTKLPDGTSSSAPPGTGYPDSEYESDSVSEDSSFGQKDKDKSRKPGDNAFRQQRLKAYNPVLTAKTVIPLLIAIAIVFVPLGAAMWYGSSRVQDMAIDYSQCELLASSDHFSEIPDRFTDFNFRTKDADIAHRPQWRLDTDESQPFDDERKVCTIQFEIPNRMTAPIYLFYRLHNFYANHRRFVKSFSEDQLEGKPASLNTIKNAVGENCSPLSNINGTRIYPCGLIANSLFNDTFSTTLSAVNGSSGDFEMTEKGIAWATDKNRFKKTRYNHTEIVPPPNWYKMFPNGYNETNVPDISTWYQFQNWMHTSALPTFNKLALRNDDDALEQGIYEISVGLHFPVLPYNGKKYIYLSQRSVIGGKNDFLGISWMVGGGVCFILGLSLLIINFIHPRRTGDVNLLSWNKEKAAADEKAAAAAEAATTGFEKPNE